MRFLEFQQSSFNPETTQHKCYGLRLESEKIERVGVFGDYKPLKVEKTKPLFSVNCFCVTDREA